MILYKKSFNEIEKSAIENLKKTRINNFNEGSRVLSIIRSVNIMLEQFYDDLDKNAQMGYLSTAQGGFLDLIGELLDCKRREGESNDNYRYRIANQVYVIAGGNKTSLEVETLNIPGVRKVRFANFTRGIGSYSAYVIADSLDQINEAVERVQEVLDSNTSFGIYGVAESPRIIPVSMSLSVIFKSGVSLSQQQTVIQEVRRSLKEYIDKLEMGEGFVASALYQIARNVSDSIFDVEILEIKINSKPILVANYNPYWDEKLYVRSIEDIDAG